jgi:hypothetical protein
MLRTIQLKPDYYNALVAVTILDHITEEEGKKVAGTMIKGDAAR